MGDGRGRGPHPVTRAATSAARRGVLATLGAVAGRASTRPDGAARYRVRGGGTDARGARCPGAGGELLDYGNSGTSMRLLEGALAGRAAAARQIGDASLSGRPMERVAVPLRQMGATVVDGRRARAR